MDDDELLELLGASLDPGDRPPPPDRVAELRARLADPAVGPAAAPVRNPPAPDLTPAPTSIAARRRPARGRVLAAAAVALVVFAAGALIGAVARGGDGGADTVGGDTAAGVVEFDGPLRTPDGGVGADLVVRRVDTGRNVTIESDRLPILPTGEFYELWFVGPDDTLSQPDRISAGTFHPDEDGRSSVRFSGAFDPARYPGISVTAEPGDGNPARTGPEVLRA